MFFWLTVFHVFNYISFYCYVINYISVLFYSQLHEFVIYTNGLSVAPDLVTGSQSTALQHLLSLFCIHERCNSAIRECKINKEDAVTFGKNKQINTSVIVIQVSNETRRDCSPTFSQYSKPWNRVPAAKDQSSNTNVVNLRRSRAGT